MCPNEPFKLAGRNVKEAEGRDSARKHDSLVCDERFFTQGLIREQILMHMGPIIYLWLCLS